MKMRIRYWDGTVGRLANIMRLETPKLNVAGVERSSQKTFSIAVKIQCDNPVRGIVQFQRFFNVAPFHVPNVKQPVTTECRSGLVGRKSDAIQLGIPVGVNPGPCFPYSRYCTGRSAGLKVRSGGISGNIADVDIIHDAQAGENGNRRSFRKTFQACYIIRQFQRAEGLHDHIRSETVQILLVVADVNFIATG